MQLTKNQKIILVIILLVILICAGIFIFFKLKNKNVPVEQNQKQEQQLPNGEDKNFNSIDFESKSETTQDSQIISASRNFIERYGTWSSQTEDFFELISSMITDNMYSQANAYITNNENFKNKKEYYGITTKVLNIAVLDSTDSSAKVSLSLQQTEDKNKVQSVFYKDVELSLIFDNGKWLIDSVMWK